MKIKVAIIGAGHRGQTFASYAHLRPDEMQVVAVADKKDYLRALMKEKYGIPDEMLFEDYDDFFAAGVIADAVFIATQDDQHVDPAVKALETGYRYLMVEKPIDNSDEKCRMLAQKAKECGATVQICHSLRYTAFYRKLKEILDSGVIGDIMSIQHLEGLGHFHQCHSYIRGDWSNSNTSSPMILAKCCHDADLFLYLTGKNCRSVSSFGSLVHFRPENAPEGSSDRCITCRHSHSCPFSATLYYNAFRSTFGVAAVEKEGYTDVTTALAEGRFGRCVYRCGNNVVDHQVVNFLMDGGTTVNMTMTGFSDVGRETRIFGTKGEIYAHLEGDVIKVSDFSSGNATTYTIAHDNSGHSGADNNLVRDFLRVIQGEAEPSTSIDISLQSHLMCNAAEKSRVNGGQLVEIVLDI